MATAQKSAQRQSDDDFLEESDLKIIICGDSAVGKSKLMERYLCDAYEPRQLSTYALTVYRHIYKLKQPQKEEWSKGSVVIDFWDTAGQCRFQTMHASYYHRAHACILVFDGTRKETYAHLSSWYKELLQCRGRIPTIVIGNKVDKDMSITRKHFKFAEKRKLPLEFTSAADGTNVVKVFEKSVQMAMDFKLNPEGNMNEEILQLVDELEKLSAERNWTTTE